jgi:hypothetical protein
MTLSGHILAASTQVQLAWDIAKRAGNDDLAAECYRCVQILSGLIAQTLRRELDADTDATSAIDSDQMWTPRSR